MKLGGGTRVASTLDLIHSDVSEPIPTTSNNGSRYYFAFINDCSRLCRVYFMKQKSEVFNFFKVIKDLIENSFAKNFKSIRSNIGGEYIKRYF